MNINTIIKKIIKKVRDVPIKVCIFQMPFALEHQTWHKINANMQLFYLMIRYANYLIIVCINIYEKFRRKRKTQNN